ncbi:MAG: hypothetical protein ACP5HK_02670 [Acidilobus sp.]
MLTPLMKYCESLGQCEEGLRASLEAYTTIVEPSMGFPRERELESASLVAGAIDCHRACLVLERIAHVIEGSNICVLAPGHDISYLKSIGGCHVIVSTDSAYEGFAGVRPDVLVGDADQSLRLLHMDLGLGVPYLVHVHGDNVYRVTGLLRLIDRGDFVITTQVETPYCSLPIGAFTDGDRAVVMAMVFSARSVLMRDLEGRPLCVHKDYCDSNIKSKKLRLAMAVTRYVAGRLGYSVEREGGLLRLTRLDS